MKKVFFIFIFFAVFSELNLNAQIVIINPDGTHSVIIDNGTTKTIVNSIGTHSTVIDTGEVKTIVNHEKNSNNHGIQKD